MPTTHLTTSAPERNLRRLVVIRSLLLGVLCTSLIIAYSGLHLALPYGALVWVLSGMTLASVAIVVQLNLRQRPSQRAFFLQLLLDIIALSLLLFFTGGANNPFVPYYLVPLCIAAATLPWFYTWPLLISSLVLYSSLFFLYLPLPALSPHAATEALHTMHGGALSLGHTSHTISLHTLGMWINFVISALLVTIFVGRMANSLRQQDEALAQLREEQLRDEQLMALATLAAGTAHELGTPLTTIRTLLAELQQDCAENTVNPATLSTDIQLLQHQANHCSQALQSLSQHAGHLQQGTTPNQPIRQLCQSVIDDWLLLRPEVSATVLMPDELPSLEVAWPATITQAMGNLLNNAADACPKDIHVDFHWDQRQLTLTLHDQGAGIDPQVANHLHEPFVTQKGEGRGLGLFLTDAVIRRFGGQLMLKPHPKCGTITQLTLPLH